MPRKRARNPLDRRADKLAAEIDRRIGSIFSKLVDPAPAFMVKKTEDNALRDYLRIRATPNGLHQLREQYGDDSVDQYVAWGENALARQLPRMMGQDRMAALEPEFTDNPSFDDEDDDDMFAPVGSDQNLFGAVGAEG